MADLPFYLYPILGYLLIFGVVYFGPLLAHVVSTGFKSEASELARRIGLEVTKERERRTKGHEGDSWDSALTEDGDSEGQEENAEAEDTGETNEEEEVNPVREEHLSRTLQSSFTSTFVDQAVKQLNTKYPDGNFRQFELERLPAYAAYDERLTAARNMSGLFVLVGLLGTMIKLEAIVQDIGNAAGASTVDASTFLDDMGLIMSNISGAFLSSVYGLALMVFFLIVIGLMDRWMQVRFDRLDKVVQQDVIPGLATLQLMQAPNLSIGDLIEETSSLLSDLNKTVDGLTEGMQSSLSDLSDQIESMMQDFGSFQKQYAELNTLIVQLQKHADNIEDVTDAIEGAAHTLQNPISDMNQELNHTIRKHMGVVGEVIEESEKNRRELASDFEALQQDVRRVLAEVKSLVRSNLEQSDKHQEEMAHRIEKQIEMMEAQSRKVEEQLESTAEALKAANSQELSRVIEKLDDKVSMASGQLSESAVDLRDASEGLKRRRQGPITLFEWMRRTVDDQLKGGNGTTS